MAQATRLTNLTTGGPVHVEVEDGRDRTHPSPPARRDRRSLVEHPGAWTHLHAAAPHDSLALHRRSPLDHLLAEADPHAPEAGGFRPQGRPRLDRSRRPQPPEPRHLRL